jgi:hypothetical protein
MDAEVKVEREQSFGDATVQTSERGTVEATEIPARYVEDEEQITTRPVTAQERRSGLQK